MPEGHTIHRHARLQRRVLVGRRVHAWSPQGRFDRGATRLDGGTVTGIQAWGKHLLYHWGDADGVASGDVLHVHLEAFPAEPAFDEAGDARLVALGIAGTMDARDADEVAGQLDDLVGVDALEDARERRHRRVDGHSSGNDRMTASRRITRCSSPPM